MSCQFSINICPFPIDGKYGQPCRFKGCEELCPMRKSDGCLKVPTFAECVKLYEARTDIEYKTKRDVRNGVLGALKELGFSKDSPFTVMTRAEFNHLKAVLKERGLDDVSVITRFSRFKALGAEDLADEYERLGWQRPLFDIPRFKPEKPKAVQEMTERQAFMIEDWMTMLRRSKKKSDHAMFIAVWLLHRFAVRNGDINRMKWKNIVKRDDGWYLVYQAHKTAKFTRRLPHPKIEGRDRLEIEPFVGDPEDYCIPRHPEKTPKTGDCRPRRADSTGTHTRMWRTINAKYRLFGIGTPGRTDKKAYCSRKYRITKAFASGGFQEAMKYGQNTPKVQLDHYIGENY